MQQDDVQRPSPEASRALREATAARASAEAALPAAENLSRRIRAQMEANHFIDLVESILVQTAGSR